MYNVGNQDENKKYWDDLLGDYITLAKFPNDFFNITSAKRNTIEKVIKSDIQKELMVYCLKNEVSIEAVLDSIFGIVLERFTYEEDVVFGKGYSMMPLRVKTFDKSERFLDLVRRIMTQIESSRKHDMKISNLKRLNALNDKLINTVFIIDDIDESKGDLSILDLYLKIELDDGIRLKLTYKSCYYDEVTSRSIIYLYEYILKQVLRDCDIKLKDIKNVKRRHREKFIEEFEKNRYDFDTDKSYVDLLREQVKKTPKNIAISDYKGDMTYEEMDRVTDRIASYLNNMGIGRGDTVAVLQLRNRNPVLSAISVLKAGAIFFPIDRTNPDERLGYLIEDGETKVILTCNSLIHRVKKYMDDYRVICIDDDIVEKNEYEITGKSFGSDEAYRISTSGTTGRPKCISIRHESLMNMCHYSIDYINVDQSDKCGVYLSFSFDAIIKQIFPYLLVGACVDVIPEYARENEYTIESYCNEKGITILALPAIIGKLFMLNCTCESLRILQVGGDKFKGYKKRGYKIFNEYGPAEFTVLCTSFEVDKYHELVPVGKPVYNTDAMVLDKNNNFCAIGVPGELCLSGIQISNGYLNNKEQNNESFVDNPYARDKYTQKMYRTGDLAKVVDDEGNIAILGRMDSQIKINGIRIEIFEIENMINMIPEVKSSVVVKREDEMGEKYLDAYYVSIDGFYDPKKVRRFLEKNLPPHMIPKNIVSLKAIPVTPIGKVDKKALPLPSCIE